jgi:hypothetical protein
VISVCVPFYERTLAFLNMQHQYGDLYGDLDLEISVCDDGSINLPALESPHARHPIKITRLPRKDYPLNPCVPINRAVEASGGEVIVLSNPEVRHDGPVLRALLALVQDDYDYATVPCYGTGYGGSEAMWLAGPLVNYATHGRLPVPPGAHFHFLAAFRRELWERVGGFDEEYRHVQACDDNDWLWRAHAAGARFHVVEDAYVHQPKSETRWGLPHGRDLFRRKWPQAFPGG